MFKELLTDPREHNPEDFIYLAHGVMGWNGFKGFMDCNGFGFTHEDIKEKLRKINDPSEFYRASLVGHLAEPHARRKIGYYGEIDQMATFGIVGLILDPAHDGLVYIAWNCDIGSPHNPEELKEYANEHRGKVRGPLALLTQTPPDPATNYNEMVLRGDESTQIKGVFWKEIDEKSEKEGRYLADVASEIIKKDLSLIKLPHRKGEDYESIEDPKERELRRQCNHLANNDKLMQLHYEFHHPEQWGVSSFGKDLSMGRLTFFDHRLPSYFGGDGTTTLGKYLKNLPDLDINAKEAKKAKA